MASDPNGINYPKDPELRRILAEEIRKIQEESGPERLATVRASEHWPEYAASVVKRLQKKEMEKDIMQKCQFCGRTHSLPCPHVKEVEYFEDGTIKRVVFKNNTDRLEQIKKAAIECSDYAGGMYAMPVNEDKDIAAFSEIIGRVCKF